MAVSISDIDGIPPISPIRLDCWDSIKIMVSPIGSESSGVSSLDSEDMKITPTAQKRPEAINTDLQIYYNGRNVLDLYNNMQQKSTTWNFRYSHLPERNNISMFWANRSLYNRLGPNGLTPVYTISKCECCDFQFTNDCPNNYFSETSLILSSTTPSPMKFTTASSKGSDYRTVKSGFSNTQPIYRSPCLNHQQSYNTDNKNCLEPHNKQQNNQNVSNHSDIFSKNTPILSNNNDGCSSNYNKFGNAINSGLLATDVSQLASNLASINVSYSTSSTTPPITNYANYATYNNDYSELSSKNSKSHVPPNAFNSTPLSMPSSNIPISSNGSFNDTMFPNNVFPNQLHANNIVGSKHQTCLPNNLFSLFNSNNANNAGFNNAFSANVESNINSSNKINNNNNNNNSNKNSFAFSSQNYGRMYKYF